MLDSQEAGHLEVSQPGGRAAVKFASSEAGQQGGSPAGMHASQEATHLGD